MMTLAVAISETVSMVFPLVNWQVFTLPTLAMIGSQSI
jgi:hypothetical protein